MVQYQLEMKSNEK